MSKYSAELILDNKLTTIEFEVDTDPIDYLWTRYGMDTFIATLETLESDEEDTTKDEDKEPEKDTIEEV